MGHDVPRQGWRYFRCPTCTHAWREASRDAVSPSGVGCPTCALTLVQESWCVPYRYELDESLPVDGSGNLTDYEAAYIQEGLEQEATRMQVTKEMAQDAGDSSLEGQWIEW